MITSQREQYGVTVHLFIGTGCSLGKRRVVEDQSVFSPLSRFHPPSSSLCQAKASPSTASSLVHPSSRSRLSYHAHLHLKAEASCDSILCWKTC
jgi:hypothetical protein